VGPVPADDTASGSVGDMGKCEAFTALILAAALAVAAAAGALVAASPARAQDCPGNPDALGTSRVLALEGEPARIGVMQYPGSLPLADKEVVLTFDDGPLPRYTNQILDILAAQCVKATFFLVGHMAHEYPVAARRVFEAGHTVGTHSEDHPSRFGHLPIERMRREIDRGIADVGAALGDPRDLAPFFRIPGLARSDTVEHELAARSLIVFSTDAVADDWYHRIKPGQIINRAMSRLDKRGKGILLLHDIHPVTVAALPGLLRALKDGGFHVVHVIAGEQPGRIEAADQRTAAPREPNWPAAGAGTPPDRIALPLPDIAAFDAGYRPERGVVIADGVEAAALIAVLGGGPQKFDPPDAGPPAAATLPAPNMRDLGILLGGIELHNAAITPPSSLAATEPSPIVPSRN
jgi:peptidoglycan/xylan/chitin deacetylase (PgdA/CDA1 family)